MTSVAEGSAAYSATDNAATRSQLFRGFSAGGRGLLQNVPTVTIGATLFHVREVCLVGLDLRRRGRLSWSGPAYQPQRGQSHPPAAPHQRRNSALTRDRSRTRRTNTRGAGSPCSASPIGPAPTRLPRIALPTSHVCSLTVLNDESETNNRCAPDECDDDGDAIQVAFWQHSIHPRTTLPHLRTCRRVRRPCLCEGEQRRSINAGDDQQNLKCDSHGYPQSNQFLESRATRRWRANGTRRARQTHLVNAAPPRVHRRCRHLHRPCNVPIGPAVQDANAVGNVSAVELRQASTDRAARSCASSGVATSPVPMAQTGFGTR